MDAKDQDISFAIAVALYRAQGQRVARAREAVIQAERKFAQLQKDEEEARAHLKEAQAEEKRKKARDEWCFDLIIFLTI